MSTKKRVRPSPAADSAQPDIDDAALRKALADKKRAKSKAAFADGACLGALTQTAAPSIGVVTLFSALALNYYIKNGPTLSEVAQSCLVRPSSVTVGHARHAVNFYPPVTPPHLSVRGVRTDTR